MERCAVKGAVIGPPELLEAAEMSCWSCLVRDRRHDSKWVPIRNDVELGWDPHERPAVDMWLS